MIQPLNNKKIHAKITPRMITKDNKSKAIKSVHTHKNDTGSPQAQVAVLTARIKEITDHLNSNKHDFMARRGLLQMVGQRRRLLRYLSSNNSKAYLETINKLGIRK